MRRLAPLVALAGVVVIAGVAAVPPGPAGPAGLADGISAPFSTPTPNCGAAELTDQPPAGTADTPPGKSGNGRDIDVELAVGDKSGIHPGESVTIEYEVEPETCPQPGETARLLVDGDVVERTLVTGRGVSSRVELAVEDHHEPAMTVELVVAGERDRLEIPVLYDRSNDGLYSYWERRGRTADGTPLPGADPGRKDIYLDVVYADDARPLSEREKERLKAWFAEMPVGNPDGSEGITLHIEERVGSDVPAYDGEDHDLAFFGDRYHSGPTRHLVVVTRMEVPRKGIAHATAPTSPVAVVDPAHETRAFTVAHELLHNLVTDIDDPEQRACGNGVFHACDGFLSLDASETYLPVEIGQQLEQQGVAPVQSRYPHANEGVPVGLRPHNPLGWARALVGTLLVIWFGGMWRVAIEDRGNWR